MKTDEKFRAAVLGVIDELKVSQIKSSDDSTITYLLSNNLVDRNTRMYGFEREALQFLIRTKVIEETGERTNIEVGIPGSSEHAVYEECSFRILQPLDNAIEMQRAAAAASSVGSTIEFHRRTGKFAFVSQNFSRFEVYFKINTLQYLLISNILRGEGDTVNFKDCAAGMDKLQSESRIETSNEEKVRNALKTIRSRLKLRGLTAEQVQSIFITNKGVRIAVPFTIIP